MTAVAHKLAAFELRGDMRERAAAASRVSLRATEDGWALLAADGTVVFRGLGTASRRECLQHARNLGVLVVAG